ncbi:response regulator [Enterococcus sp. CWB-B31]|uniref:response regulator transcription factor n=1 Tax=Enterococcus sp. CWB-B31 TaxID=2885159 RepID=UPI001E43EB54|nr:response regulator transcription factor [Enterococcus sp. CWB-B31]MCB5954596.1 response regulator transcription factor [Enterococcus sp. CWB-B31]
MNIYLLDDHILFSKSLEITFSSLDVSLKSFTCPERLFKQLESQKPDIIILDIHIGEFNGFDISKELFAKYPDSKVVFLSGFDLFEYKNQALKSGAQGFFNKNSTIEELYDSLFKVHKGINLLQKSQDVHDILSEREKEILKFAADGIKQQEIADLLQISRRTVNNHLQSINQKLYVNSTVSAILQAIELGIIRVKGY